MMEKARCQGATYYLAQKPSRTGELADPQNLEQAFARFVKLLTQLSRSQEAHLRESYSIHQHFCLTSSTLDILDANFRAIHTVGFESSFYDTPKFDLAHHNLWLNCQQDSWALKYCTPATNENLVVFHVERSLEAIKNLLAETLDLSSDEIERLFTTPYVKMNITRRTYFSPGCSLYVDAAQLASGDYYLVGTVCLPAESAPSLDLLEALTPVRSRVVEYLYHYNRSLYDELVEEKVLPDLHTHYPKELTHRRRDPFYGPTAERFDGEEAQLLASVDVNPDDEDYAEAVTTYKEGAAEAKMEWLPFLRMVSGLFKKGVEQGVYAPVMPVGS